VPVPRTAARHRRRQHRQHSDAPSSRLTLLAILAALTVAFSSGVALTLTASQSPAPPAGASGAVTGETAIGTPPPTPGPLPTATPDQPVPGSQALVPSPLPTAEPAPQAADRSRRQQPQVDEITALENQVAALTNAERAAAGCGELRMDEYLRTAARGHSADMARHGYFSHTGLDGSSPSDRARAAGYDGGVGENIAMGYRTPEDVVHGWMTSDGHRANILNCSYAAIGVGLAYDDRGRPYWTQKFGRH
jgi:uncharacterized protein YkwD